VVSGTITLAVQRHLWVRLEMRGAPEATDR
jgi:hypothetical protein